MSETGLPRYVVSCGVLTVPIVVWNFALTPFLPPALASHEFSRDIPPLVTYGENALRIAVMVVPFLMPLEVATVRQRRGVRLFVVGTIVYFLSWMPLMIVPQSSWSTSWLGFVAPAYTPLVWLTGLGLLGRPCMCPCPSGGGCTSAWPAASSPFMSRTRASCTRDTTDVTQVLTTSSAQ